MRDVKDAGLNDISYHIDKFYLKNNYNLQVMQIL